MKRIATLVALTCAGNVFAQQYHISGELAPVYNGRAVYLNELLPGNTLKLLDSAQVQNGRFSIKGKAAIPFAAMINIDEPLAGYRYFFVDKADNIALRQAGSGAAYNALKAVTVKGSGLTAQWEELEAALAPVNDSLAALLQQPAPPDTGVIAVRLRHARLRALIAEKERVKADFFVTHPDYYVGLHLFNALLQVKGIATTAAENMFRRFTPELRSTPLGKSTKALIDAAARVSWGKPAPEFSARTDKARKFTLSSLEGKFVLLHFWSSRCTTCPDAFPDLMGLYSRYHDRNLAIVSVSTDQEEDVMKWIGAIRQHRLPWQQVWDPGGEKVAAKLYNVTDVPATFLLSPAGNIIGINLKIPVIDRTLQMGVIKRTGEPRGDGDD